MFLPYIMLLLFILEKLGVSGGLCETSAYAVKREGDILLSSINSCDSYSIK